MLNHRSHVTRHRLCIAHVISFVKRTSVLILQLITCNSRNCIHENSCQPCAVQSFLGNRLQLRALADVRIGDEVTISYIDCLDTAAQRKRKLQVTLSTPTRP